MVRIKFVGATGTVTGSKTLLELDGKKFLVDCGMFQGLKRLRHSCSYRPLWLYSSISEIWV